MHRFQIGIGAVVLGLIVIGATPSFAQLNSQGGINTPTSSALQRGLKGAAPTTKTETAPPVLPGTKVAPEAAPATAGPGDMSPTEALFDAINRGDLQAARDAVNRGGELNAQNSLGLTPLELSVDLGRNNISFMLLSMRGDSAAARREARVGTQSGGPVAELITGGRATPRAASQARVVAASSRGPAEEAEVAPPRYNSGNGGVPIPAAGFLGFDEGRSVR